MLLFLLSALVALSAWWALRRRLPAGFPPGPRAPLPVLGDLLSVGTDLTRGYAALAEKYGDIVGFWIGHEKTVLLASPELISKALSMDQVSDRPVWKEFERVRGTLGKDAIPGVILSNGQTWVEQRRFTLRTLRDFGMGKTGMEELISDEVGDLCDRIEKGGPNHPFQMKGFFDHSGVRALWRIITNEDVDQEDKSSESSRLPALWKRMDKVTAHSNLSITQIAIQYPIVSEILERIGMETFGIIHKGFSSIAAAIVDKHEKTFQDDSLRDFTDIYLRQRRENAGKPGSSFSGEKGLLNQRAMLADLMNAGTDTISNTLSWTMLFMAKNQDVQRKVQQELDEAVGRSNPPCWSDRLSTPYTEAALHEAQRMANVTPWGVTRQVKEDIRLGGHFLPAGTQIIPLIGTMMHDRRWFKDPHKFDPTRYINKEGKFEANQMVMPFGYGKRRCAGELLARMELYRYVTGVLHRFSVEAAADGTSVDRVEPSLGQINSPSEFELKFVPRS